MGKPPSNARKQRLLDMMRETPGSVKFAGIRVCARAFQKLSGVSAGLMQISKKVVNVWSDSSLSWMQIRETSKAKRYLDARSWIEIYGETHGEKSPMSLKVYLLCWPAENTSITLNTSSKGHLASDTCRCHLSDLLCRTYTASDLLCRTYCAQERSTACSLGREAG